MLKRLLKFIGIVLLVLFYGIPQQVVVYVGYFSFVYAIYVAPVFLDYGGGGCLANGLGEKYHNDWLWGAGSMVKRKYTVLCGIGSPIQVAGNQDYHIGSHELKHPKPIPLLGQWQLSRYIVKTRCWEVELHYFAKTGSKFANANLDMYHGHIGWRWDDLDDYLTFSIALKKIPYNWERFVWLWQKKSWERNLG